MFGTPQLTVGAELSHVEAALQVAGAPGERLPAAAVTARFPGLAAGGSALLEPARFGRPARPTSRRDRPAPGVS